MGGGGVTPNTNMDYTVRYVFPIGLSFELTNLHYLYTLQTWLRIGEELTSINQMHSGEPTNTQNLFQSLQQ